MGTGMEHDSSHSERRRGLREHVAALHETLAAAREDREYDTARLRAAVAAVATAARAEQIPPERLVILLKGLTSGPAVRHVSYWWLRVLTDRFVRWGIEAYYGLESEAP
jgi:hypothetical protein